MTDQVIVTSIEIGEGGSSQAIAVSGVSAQSAILNFEQYVITPTVDVFVRQGENPTALANGTDMILLGGLSYRVRNVKQGNLMAFITSGATGTVYLTPGA